MYILLILDDVFDTVPQGTIFGRILISCVRVLCRSRKKNVILIHLGKRKHLFYMKTPQTVAGTILALNTKMRIQHTHQMTYIHIVELTILFGNSRTRSCLFDCKVSSQTKINDTYDIGFLRF
jgi:hypothetical protein